MPHTHSTYSFTVCTPFRTPPPPPPTVKMSFPPPWHNMGVGTHAVHTLSVSHIATYTHSGSQGPEHPTPPSPHPAKVTIHMQANDSTAARKSASTPAGNPPIDMDYRQSQPSMHPCSSATSELQASCLLLRPPVARQRLWSSPMCQATSPWGRGLGSIDSPHPPPVPAIKILIILPWRRRRSGMDTVCLRSWPRASPLCLPKTEEEPSSSLSPCLPRACKCGAGRQSPPPPPLPISEFL